MKLPTSVFPYLATLLAWYIRLVSATSRWRICHDEHVRALVSENQRFILAFWHGKLCMIPEAYRWLGGKTVTVLISEHRDGELITQVIARWGYKTVRGSSRRGAVKGTIGLVRAAKRGSDLAITPDGPKGPAHKAQGGVVELARMTGLPVVPVTYAARGKRFASWDAFLLPYPLSRGVVVWGKPLWIENDGERNQDMQRIEDALNRLDDEAEAALK